MESSATILTKTTEMDVIICAKLRLDGHAQLVDIAKGFEMVSVEMVSQKAMNNVTMDSPSKTETDVQFHVGLSRDGLA